MENEEFAGIMEDPEARLAQTFIEEFLMQRHLTEKLVHCLENEEARKIMVEASIYASTRMAELEKRAHLVHELHGNPEF